MAKKQTKRKASAPQPPSQAAVPKPSPEAEALKDQGNEFFKAKNFQGAVEKFSQARDLAPQVPIYSGNLAYALIEVGEYADAIDNIIRTEELIKQQSASGRSSAPILKLRTNLSLRFGKCLYRAAADNCLTAKMLENNKELISSLRTIEAPPGSLPWWDWYDRVYFDALPLRKSSLATNIEFFTIGHDNFHSMLQGVLDSWGTTPERTCPGDSDALVRDIPPVDRRALSFLYGGVGDARHVFSTFLDIWYQSTDLIPMHFTLLDIQPAVLTRDLIFLLLLWNTPISPNNARELWFLSAKTMFYVFSGAAMPPDSHALLLKTCRQLKNGLNGTGRSLPAFIVVDPGLIPEILTCVEFWIDLPSSITTAKVLRHVGIDSADFLAQITNPSIRRECEAYSSLKVLLPPYATRVDPHLEPWHEQVEYGAPKDLGPVRQYIEKNWKPNPTLFDKPNHDLYERGHYPKYFEKLSSPNGFVIKALGTLFSRLSDLDQTQGSQGTDPRWPSFTIFMVAFFRPLSSALQHCGSEVKFEFIAGDVVRFLSLLKSGSPSLDWRQGSPTSFTRAWMSNVPDYAGGPLEMALYAVPALQPTLIASVGMNCLFKAPHGRITSTTLCTRVYTLLLPDQLPKYLGCTIRWYRNVSSVLHPPFCLLPCKLPFKPSELATQPEFEGWVHRVLMRILAPPPIRMIVNYMVLLPTTLRTVVQLLTRAIEIGYPVRWISDFIDSLLSDTLHSTWRPYQSTPMSADTINKQYSPTKIQLSSWMADIEVVVAAALPVLPRGLTLSYKPIGILETAVYQTSVNQLRNPQSYSLNPGLALLFCAPGFNPARSGFNTYSVLLSKTATGNEVQIYYSILTCVVDTPGEVGTVSWRMSIERVERMKRDGWSLYLWQADAPFVASSPSDASEWAKL
ncbi:hypothetical protein C8R43DRAFT_74135 [Mycena crocata]|nr:hypothetical protein C8R43DRAFT_74135 [Mycena crocata]